MGDLGTTEGFGRASGEGRSKIQIEIAPSSDLACTSLCRSACSCAPEAATSAALWSSCGIVDRLRESMMHPASKVA